MTGYDYSTLNLDVLRRQPKVTRVALGSKCYQLQRDPGNGCYGDPPGYPTYFTRSVYTSKGHTPRGFCAQVIVDPEDPDTFWSTEMLWGKGDTWEIVRARHKELMRELYKPLPVDHSRVLAWAISCAVRGLHCYVDPQKPADKRRNISELVLWPVPYYQLRHFHDDSRFSDEWRNKEKASIDQANSEILAAARLVAVVENASLLYDLHEVYPDITPDTALAEGMTPRKLLENPPDRHSGDWWERHALRPTPDSCCPPSWLGRHRTDGWCQFCGYESQGDDQP